MSDIRTTAYFDTATGILSVVTAKGKTIFSRRLSGRVSESRVSALLIRNGFKPVSRWATDYPYGFMFPIK